MTDSALQPKTAVAAVQYLAKDDDTEETEAPALAATGTAHAHVVDARSQLDEYLAGLRREFTVPVDWSRTTGFDADVLRDVLATTGYGVTTTYGAIAQRMGVEK
jgi:methylated-DNA-[protein]-cysteine S-methyltransferase